MLKNSENTYGWVSIHLHWFMAILIVTLFALGLSMVDLDYASPWYNSAPLLHESIGILLFALLIFRTIWRQANPLPQPAGNPWEKRVALLVHRAHYVLMFCIVITGYLIPTAKGEGIMVFNWFMLPSINPMLGIDEFNNTKVGKLHWLSAWAIVALTIIHAAAALKHHFINHDTTLTRMLGINKSSS